MTLSDDGQWMWDGNQWVPAQSASPAPPPTPSSNLAFTDPNSPQSPAPPFGGQPMMAPNPGGWAPDNPSPSSASSIPVAVIVTIVILVVGGATGGILWATGVFGSSGDDLIGVWYHDDDNDGIQFKEDGSFVHISEGSPSPYFDHSQTWSVSGDELTVIIVDRDFTGEFTCDDGDTISARWVNDGDEDCDGGEDEGVDTSNMPYEDETQTIVLKFEIEGDVLFIGLLSETHEEDGSVQSHMILEDKICSSDDSECSASVRAGALNNLNHATVVSGVTAPDWYVPPPVHDDYDDYDY